jgi:Tfp pilus assembly protein PilO
MLDQQTATEREIDVMMDLRKSVDELVDQMKELNQKLPKSYELDDLIKSLHKLAQGAESRR